MSLRHAHSASTAAKTIALLIAGAVIGNSFASAIAIAWTGPSDPPPAGNVAAPVNVGAIAQLKDGTLGVNGLAVFGNTILQGSSYLNFGPTAGTAGYGVRDNAGVLEFKNSGGSWASLQSTVSTLVGSSSPWVTSGTNIYNANSGNVGIGMVSAVAKLDVAGEVKVADTGLACNASTAGAMRYNSGAMQYCNGSVWVAIGPAPGTAGSQCGVNGDGVTMFTATVPRGRQCCYWDNNYAGNGHDSYLYCSAY